jgi:hypothetical protein
MAFAQHGDQGQVDRLILADNDLLNVFTQAAGGFGDHGHLGGLAVSGPLV